MARPQQIDFCQSVKSRFPAYFSNKFVLDVGSLDLGGNNGALFSDCVYLGLDLKPGDNVDICCPAHKLNMPDSTFDTIISTECFQHDLHYVDSFENICRMLKPGGLFLFGCATVGRPEHGTRRTTPQDAPFLQNEGTWGDYYKPLTEDDIGTALVLSKVFTKFHLSTDMRNHDLFFWGIKHGEFISRRNYSIVNNASSIHRKYTKLQESVAQLQAEISRRDETIIQLRTDSLDQEARSATEAGARMGTSLLEVVNHLEDIENLKRRLHALSQTHDADIRSKDAEAALRVQALEAAHADALDQTRKTFAAEIQKIVAEHQASMERSRQSIAELAEDFGNYRADTKNIVQTLEADLAANAAMLAELVADRDALKTSVKTLTEEKGALEVQSEALARTLGEIRTELADCLQALEASTLEKADLQRQLSERTQAFEHLQSEIASLTARLMRYEGAAIGSALLNVLRRNKAAT